MGFEFTTNTKCSQNTPGSHIRSVAMVLVKVRRSATTDETLTSPLTHTLCFFYKVNIESWESDRGRGYWPQYWRDIRSVMRKFESY
jgi:hypothetical protein